GLAQLVERRCGLVGLGAHRLALGADRTLGLRGPGRVVWDRLTAGGSLAVSDDVLGLVVGQVDVLGTVRHGNLQGVPSLNHRGWVPALMQAAGRSEAS